MFGSAIVTVVALVAFVLWMSRDKPKPPEEKKVVADRAVDGPTPDEPEEEVVEKKASRPQGRRRVARTRSVRSCGKASSRTCRSRRARGTTATSQAEIQTYPWPDYVTAEERNKIEEAITNLELGGIDAQDAEKYLIELDARSDDGTAQARRRSSRVSVASSASSRTSSTSTTARSATASVWPG